MITHDELNELSMQIILLAGDARNEVYQALEQIEHEDYVNADQHLRQARGLITNAHQVQTHAIQSEAKGEAIPYSALFSHAQDTLMTIMSEINLTQKLIKIFSRIDEKLLNR
jgi:cellobiose PTS system EIIA component